MRDCSLAGKEDKKRQETRLFLSWCLIVESGVTAGRVQDRAKSAKDENKKGERDNGGTEVKTKVPRLWSPY